MICTGLMQEDPAETLRSYDREHFHGIGIVEIAVVAAPIDFSAALQTIRLSAPNTLRIMLCAG
jgi:hypothetical protein